MAESMKAALASDWANRLRKYAEAKKVLKKGKKVKPPKDIWSDNSYLKRFVLKIIENIEVTIADVDFSYHDRERTCGGAAVCARAFLGELVVSSCTETWAPKYPRLKSIVDVDRPPSAALSTSSPVSYRNSHGQKALSDSTAAAEASSEVVAVAAVVPAATAANFTLRKQLAIRDLWVRWESLDNPSDLGSRESPYLGLGTPSEQEGGGQYMHYIVQRDTGLQVRGVYTDRATRNTPKLRLMVDVPAFDISLSKKVFQEALQQCTYLIHAAQAQQLASLRPGCRPGEDARAW
jgi:hypothetical protein